jgi:hypothetical protein
MIQEAQLILALMLGFTPKTIGPSVEEVTQDTPGARWEPCYEGGWKQLGEKKNLPCRPYASNTVRGAWVITESRESRAKRLQLPAITLYRVAQENAHLWPGTVHEYAIAMATAAGWSTGFREDIQVGRARGPDGEVCLADTTIETARRHSNADIANLPKGELQLMLVGRNEASLTRCFTVLARGLANAYRYALRACKGAKQPALQSGFAVYGNGRRCVTGGRLAWQESKRFRTWARWVPRTVPVWPEWYRPAWEAAGVGNPS